MIYIAALVFGVTGFILAHLIVSGGAGNGWQSLAIWAGVAAFGVSLLLWRVICASDQQISWRRGALVGILTGVLAHPVAWYLMAVWMYASGERASLGERTVTPLEAIPACFIFAAWSLFLAGWITVPAGGIIGGILGKALRRR